MHGGDRSQGLLFGVHDEAVDAMLDYLRYGTTVERDHRRTAGHRLYHDESEGFRPSDGKQQGPGITKEFGLSCIANLADEFDEGMVE